MDELKNYKWAEALKVSPKVFNEWKQDKNNKSFLSWALSQKAIDRSQYFKWAVEFYKLPLLDNAFFEQNLIPQDQWNQLNSLEEWNEHLAPVLMEEDTVFVGCIEPPKNTSSWNFKYRIVLVTDTALRMHLKCMQELTHIKQQTQTGILTPKSSPHVTTKPKAPQANATSSLAKQPLKQEVNLEDVTKVTQIFPHTLTQTDVTKTNVQVPTEKKIDIQPELKLEDDKLNAGATKINIQVPTEKKMDIQPELKLEDDKLNADTTKTSVQVPTEKKIDIQPELKLEDDKSLSVDVPPSPSTPTHKIEENQPMSVHTTTCFKISSPSYEDLFLQAKHYFSTMLVLEKIENKLFPVNWHGKVSELNKSTPLVNLEDFSLFKILKSGHAYHGFIIDKEANKKIFNQLGWAQYPKHVTALPIKNEAQELEFVFLGLSMNSPDSKTIKQIEDIVFTYFSSLEKEVKKAS